jgi:sulfide dehydrogenase cytochrome subunit
VCDKDGLVGAGVGPTVPLKTLVARAAILLIPLVFGPSPVAAAEMTPAVAAAACSACHGPGGKSSGSIPSLNELDFAGMDAMLKSFRAGELAATIMTRIAKGFTDDEIDALAKFMTTR